MRNHLVLYRTTNWQVCFIKTKSRNRNCRIKILVIKHFKTNQKPITKGVETKSIVRSEFKTEKGFFCRSVVIKSGSKTVMIVGAGLVFGKAFFTKAASGNPFSAGNAVIGEKRISEALQFI